jgi:predicted DNA-binding protein with PD1-like motif
MTYQFDGYNYLLRLNKGEQLVACLTDFVREQGVAGGWVSGIGGALAAELGFYDLVAQHYRWKKLDQLLEITSLQGNIAWDNEEPFLHLHGTFSGVDMQTIGGHVKELTVGGTCEIFLHAWNKDRLKRSPDNETGLKLLDL